MRAFRAYGGETYPAGLLVVMPNGELAPPLVFSALPVWEQHWNANAPLRVEEIDPLAIHPEYVAEICRTTLAGPGARVATPTVVRREVRDPAQYDVIALSCQAVLVQARGKQWYSRFTCVAPDGAIEGWQVAGFARGTAQADCVLVQPSGTCPPQRRG